MYPPGPLWIVHFRAIRLQLRGFLSWGGRRRIDRRLGHVGAMAGPRVDCFRPCLCDPALPIWAPLHADCPCSCSSLVSIVSCLAAVFWETGRRAALQLVFLQPPVSTRPLSAYLFSFGYKGLVLQSRGEGSPLDCHVNKSRRE